MKPLLEMTDREVEEHIAETYRFFGYAWCEACHDHVKFDKDDRGHARCKRCEARITPVESS